MNELHTEFAAQVAALSEVIKMLPSVMAKYGPLLEEHVETALEGDLSSMRGIEMQLGYTFARAAMHSDIDGDEKQRAKRILEEMIQWYPAGAGRIRFERGIRMGIRTA